MALRGVVLRTVAGFATAASDSTTFSDPGPSAGSVGACFGGRAAVVRDAAGLRGVPVGFLVALDVRAAGVLTCGVGLASGRSGSESTRQPYQPPTTVRGSITKRQHKAGRSGPQTRVAANFTKAQWCVQKFTYRQTTGKQATVCCCFAEVD